MCYLYLKLMIFLERKVQPKSVEMSSFFYIYSINYIIDVIEKYKSY